MIFPGSSAASALAIFDTAYFPEIEDGEGGSSTGAAAAAAMAAGAGSNAASAAASSSYSYLSPISAINQDIRRKNVAAAAAATSGPHLSAVDVSDPWDRMTTSNDNNQEYYCYNGSSGVGVGDPLQHQHSSAQTPGAERRRRYSLALSCSCSIRGGPSSPLHASRNAAAARAYSYSSGGDNSGGGSGGGGICPKCGKKIVSVSASSQQQATITAVTTGSSDYLLLAGEPQHARALLHSTPHLRFVSPASTDMQGVGHSKQMGNFFLQFMGWTPGQSSASGGGTVGTFAGTANSVVSAGSAGNLSQQGSKSAIDGHSYPSSAAAAHHISAGVSSGGLNTGNVPEYQASLIRDRANQLAASELASLLWVLAHEMSLEDYGTVESEVFSAVFGLVHSNDKERRMAGLAAVDALLATPSADEEKKAIKFANTLATGLRAAHGDYEFLSAVSKALGHMAKRTANVDFVESEVTRALEWLRMDRSDRR